MVISLGLHADRPPRRLGDGSRPPALASNLLTADSEIAAGRIALFTPASMCWPAMVTVALALARASADCQRGSAALPRLSPGTLALCSSDFPLTGARPGSDHPSFFELPAL